MRRIIVFTLLALTLTGGAAFADHYRRGGSYRGDYRADYRGDYRAGGGVTIRNPNDRVWTDRSRQRVYRRPIYVNNGYYEFRNGSRYRYARPVIHRRYYDYRVRPQVIVENYETVPGYIWVQGNWQWNGYEWIWASGHYDVDHSCDYDDGIRY